MKRGYVLATALLGLAGLAGALILGLPASASSSSAAPFAAQARAAGYTDAQSAALQREIDQNLALYGGKQVAINKIEFSGGNVLLPLPGETTARELGSDGTAAPMSYLGCADRSLCIWNAKNYTGQKTTLTTCQKFPIGLKMHGSWVNNQTAGTVGTFYFFDANNNEAIFGLTGRPQAFKADAYWAPVTAIRNC